MAVVLHGHLPFVRHPEHERFFEEDWLFEAAAECYLPMLDTFERLVADGVAFRVSLGLSPTLLSMLSDPLLMGRCWEHLERSCRLAGSELQRTILDPELSRLARMYAARFARARRQFDDLGGDLIGAFVRLVDSGHLELLTCAATHAFLPLVQRHPRVVDAQLRQACATHRRLLGRRPAGIWLPECGTYAGLDERLAAAGLAYTIVDTHGLLWAQPKPLWGVYAPVLQPAGVAAFGRDRASAQQVWSAESGYPADPEYRDFYRDIGFDLDLDYLGEHVQPTGARKATGFKYHRITGPTTHKGRYRPERARARALAHARHFVDQRLESLAAAGAEMNGLEPILVAPYDAELFGHWWAEGPWFLEAVLRELARRPEVARADSPGRYLARQSALQVACPAASSWGQGGYGQVWLNERTDWIYNHLDRACGQMVALAGARPAADGLFERGLNQAARELMLAQASDWAFLVHTQTAPDYAWRRTAEHLANFQRLATDLEANRPDPDLISRLEQRNNLFPDMDYRIFRSDYRDSAV